MCWKKCFEPFSKKRKIQTVLNSQKGERKRSVKKCKPTGKIRKKRKSVNVSLSCQFENQIEFIKHFKMKSIRM